MKIHETRKHTICYNHKRFGDIPGGTIFMYHGACYVKFTEQLYRMVKYSDEPRLEIVHAIVIGTCNDKNTGHVVIFNVDSEVTVYPDAAVYLKG